MPVKTLHLLIITFLTVFVVAPGPLSAEPQPGDVCPETDRFMRVSGPENPGSGHFLFCDGNLVWQPVLRFQSAGHVLFNSSGLPAAPLHVWGEIQFSSSGLACGVAQEGAVRYTGGDPPWEFCDGSAWVNFKQPRCQDDDTGECYLDAARSNDDPEFVPGNILDGVNILGVTGTLTDPPGPSGCASIGDLCADGTVFAGWHPITYDHLFIPTADQAQPGDPSTFTMNWKNATGLNDISTDSNNDGQINHANRGGAIGDFQAFQTCEDLSFGGQTDWYLPSQVELYYIWSIRVTIEAGGNITNFQNDYYWSSTEYDTLFAWVHNFPNGDHYNGNKTSGFRVRCVRRD